MKKIRLFIFSLFIIFSFNIYVNAALTCGSGGTKVTIKETGITSAGFTAKVPKCRMEKTGNYMTVEGSESRYFSQAVDSGKDYKLSAQMDAENKNMSTTYIPKCTDPDAKVRVSVSCKKENGYKEPIKAEAKTDTMTRSSNEKIDGWTCTEIPGSPELNLRESLIGVLQLDISYSCTKDYTYYTCNGVNQGDSDSPCCPTNYEMSNEHCCPTGSVWNEDNCYTYYNNSIEIDIEAGYYAYSQTVRSLTELGHNNLGTDMGARSVSCDRENTLLCPIYKCTEDHINVGACSPDYQVKGSKEDAYCINPGQSFPKNNNGEAEYEVDNDFDVNACSNSYSTVDCGYANILIESAYNKKNGIEVSNDAVNIALRLWGAHSTQRGFAGIGIANVIGDSCNEWGFLYNNGNGVNVYKYTEKYIRETLKTKFYDVAYTYDYIPPSGKKLGETFDKITCAKDGNSSLLGVMCGENTAYRQGIDLFFNTLIGNKEMKNHLALLFGGAVDTKPDNIKVVTGSEEKDGYRETKFELEYEEFENLDTEEIVFDCDNLDEVSASDRIKIEPYCQTIIYLVDETGKTLKDSTGKVYDPVKVDECRKGSGCTTKSFSYAVCTRTGQKYTPVYYKIQYYDNNVNTYLRKYQSCDNPGVNQIMFAFEDEKLSKEVDSTEKTKRKISKISPIVSSIEINCQPGDEICNETGTNKTGSSGKFGRCEDSDRNNTFTSEIKDPSLKCIVNMPSYTRDYYDYSDYFGVNSNLCRIYCSDEVDYTFSNRISAVAGETFSYDIGMFSYKETTSEHKLSSIISEKRTCVSQIYYSMNFPEEIDWKRIYGITDSDIKNAELNSINNASQLLSVLAYKSKNENGRTENLNQVVFDLFNCYLLPKNSFSGLDTPKNIAIENVYENIKYLYGKDNNYGFDDSEHICSKDSSGKVKCSSTSNTSKCSIEPTRNRETCIDMQGVQYMFGAEYADNQRINEVTLDVDKSSVKTSISNVSYCTGSNCMKYSKGNQDVNYDYSGWVNYDNSSYVTDSGSGKKIPNYNYAKFEIRVDVGLYNNKKFQTKPGSGYIVDITDNKEDKSYITLDDYSYPISKDALTLNNNACATIEDNTSEITKRCSVEYVLGASISTPMIHTFYRKNRKDTFFNDVNSSDNRFTCSIDVTIPKVTTCKNCGVEVATIYRNVNPSNIFPNNINYEDSNWATVDGQIATNAIETTSDQIRTTNNLLDYSVELSTSQILALREYNQNNKAYNQESIFGCIEIDNTYRNCKSNFLEILRGATNQDNKMYATISETYNGSKYFGNE